MQPESKHSVQKFNVCNIPETGSLFVSPKRLEFELNGRQRKWDVVEPSDSVVIMIYDKILDCFVLVKQFRAAVYFADVLAGAPVTMSSGYTVELCAGLVDKEGKSVEQIAVEEVFEECGYRIKTTDLIKINQARHAVGISGGIQNLFCAVVTPDMRVPGGKRAVIICGQPNLTIVL